jgi:SAM-dependent methyltransferase
VHIIHTIAELDDKIAECNEAEKRSEEAMRALLGSFHMQAPKDLPRDPFTQEYREAQLELYREITGKPYSPQNEATKFDVDAALARPFPFYTRSTAVAGEYFMAIGFVLHSMGLPPASRVLEFGAGWGYTSVILALLGHQVTVIDIEPCFCTLIDGLAKRAGVDIEVINADFFFVEKMEREFDAVLFYDCFHHCDDHLRLLQSLTKVVAPNGCVYFGAEPISPDFPMSWGLRLDGWALWGIRKNGWMELGFRDDYFSQALSRTGWFGRKISISGLDRLRIWEARHKATASFRFPSDSPSLQTHVGRREAGGIVFDNAKAGTGLFGPYVDLPAGRYVVRIVFNNSAVLKGRASMDVACDNGGRRLAFRYIDLSGSGPSIAELEFFTDIPRSGVEVRLFCSTGFTATIAHVEIAVLA